MVQSALSVHLNIEERVLVNTSTLFFSVEKLLPSSLENKYIRPQIDTLMRLPVMADRSWPGHVPMIIQVRDLLEQHVVDFSLCRF